MGGTDENVLSEFEHTYLGDWSSLTDYAEHLLADSDLDETLDRVVPQGLRHYVDVDDEGLGRDLELGATSPPVGRRTAECMSLTYGAENGSDYMEEKPGSSARVGLAPRASLERRRVMSATASGRDC